MTQEEWLGLKAGLVTHAEKAFVTLYNHLWSKLYGVTLNYVRDTATAQEIVQDVFVVLWEKREQLQNVADIRSFAMRCVQNRIYDHFDKQSVRERYALRVSRTENASLNSTEHQVEFDETYHLIDVEIERLPATTRKIFRLSRFDRFTNEEIASHLDLSVKSVEYHVGQALKKLRVRLKYTGILIILFTLVQ